MSSTGKTTNGSGEQLERRRRGIIGLTLFGALISAWASLHVYAVFHYQWGTHSIVSAPVLAAVICWLYVGLFIVAHDCMHGSLVPFRPAMNRAVGRLCLFLYAGFNYDALNRKHHLHHRHAGTPDDPDFDATPPHGWMQWYSKFLREYMTLREVTFFTVVTTAYLFVFGASYANLLAFWALPAILSSVQLFVFGTYLPHKPTATPFTDRHRAYSNDYSWLWSLLTCFHFGYHHEHHLHPDVPWWRLPCVRAELTKTQP